MSTAPLPSIPPHTNPVLLRRDATAVVTLAPHAPALQAMTDFRHECPVVVAADRPIDDALHDMITIGVRALIVVEDGRVLGLITAADLLGERPLQFLQTPPCEHRQCRHSDIRVEDIMTPWIGLRTLPFAWVANATIADVTEALMASEATHLVVVDEAASEGGPALRGLFSRTRMERHLGQTLRRAS